MRYTLKSEQETQELSVTSIADQIWEVVPHNNVVSPNDPNCSSPAASEGRISVKVLSEGNPCTLLTDGRPIQVHLSSGRLQLNGQPLDYTVLSEHERAAGPSRGAGRSRSGEVASPMPGRILRVLVEEGQQVEADQPVVIIEAMKMENQLLAPHAGTVKDIAVQAGDTVDAGRCLLKLARSEG